MPQLEDGYTKIANEVLDALVKFRIPGVERQCLDFILRKTYGYNKKSDRISNSQFVGATGLKKGNVSKSIKSLVNKNIVIKRDNNYIPTYEFNKKYKSWKQLSKKKPVIKKETRVIKKETVVIKKDGHTELSKSMDTKETTLQKTTLQKKEVFFLHLKPDWMNDKDWEDMIIHRRKKKASMTDRAISAMIKQFVMATQKGFTVEECVDEYAQRNWIGFKADWMKKETNTPKINSVHQAKIVEDDAIAKALLEKERRETEKRDGQGTHLQIGN